MSSLYFAFLSFPQLVITMSCFNKHQSLFYYPVNDDAKEDSNISKCRHTLGLCSHWNALSVWIRGDFKPMQREQFNDNDADCGKDNDNGPLGRPRTQSETIVSKVDCFFAIAASHYSCYCCYCCQWWWLWWSFLVETQIFIVHHDPIQFSKIHWMGPKSNSF